MITNRRSSLSDAARPQGASKPAAWPRYTPAIWPIRSSTPSRAHSSATCSTNSVPRHPTLLAPRTTRDLAAHLVLRDRDYLAGPGLILPGAWGRLAERRRRDHALRGGRRREASVSLGNRSDQALIKEGYALTAGRIRSLQQSRTQPEGRQLPP